MRIAPAVAIVHLECMMMITQTAIVGIVALECTVMPMINIIGSLVAFMGAMIFGWIGNLPMTIAMLAGVIYFKE